MKNINYFVSAILGWVLLNCLIVGGYKIYTEYKNWNPDVLDPQEFVASLTHEERAELSGIILNYKEPSPTPTRRN